MKKFIPHLIAIGIFSILTVVYFFPNFQGMVLQQGDIVQWKAMSKEITDWNAQHPDEPALWTSRLFSGMPSAQISLPFPGNFSSKILGWLGKIFPDASAMLFLHLIGFYVLLLCLGVHQWLAVAGAIAFAFSSFTLISLEAGHNTKVQAMGLMAPVLGGVWLCYRKNILVGAALTAFALSLLIAANHLQITYYLIICVGLISLFELVSAVLEKRIKEFSLASLALILAALLAVGPNIANLWMTRDYGKETIRGGRSELTRKKAQTDGGLDFEYASRWSYGFTDLEFLSVLIPNIKGGASGTDVGEDAYFAKALSEKGYPTTYAKQAPTYWGEQPFTSGPVYFGAVVFFLFVFALLYVQGPLKWWALILTVISFLLAFGYHTPFFRMAFEILPFFNKFRTPSMALVIAQLIFPFLGLYGLHIFLSQKKFEAKDRQKLLMAFGITGGLALVAGLAGSYVYSYEAESDKQLSEQGLNFLVDALRKDRAAMLRTDALRSILFSAAAFYLLWRFFKQQIEFKWLVPAIAAIILVDEWSVSRRYLNEENFVDPSEYDKSFSMTAADMEILRDPDPNFRVYNLTRDPFNDAMTSYYHKHIGGYHAAKLIRYQDLIEEHISKGTPQVINMLNTRYIIQKGSDGQPQVRRNPGALGNAWIVKNIRIVKNADEEIGMLGKEDFSPSETAILDQKFSKFFTSTNYNNSQSSVTQTFFSPNKISYSVSSQEKVFVVFSEIFYPEWNCYVDGKLTPYARVNYVLRGLEVSPGNHTIEFKIEPKAYFIGNKIAYAGSALLLLFVFSIAGIHLRPYWQQTSELQKNSSSKKNRQP